MCTEDCEYIDTLKAVVALGTGATTQIQQDYIDAAICQEDPVEKYCCADGSVTESPSTISSTTALGNINNSIQFKLHL